MVSSEGKLYRIRLISRTMCALLLSVFLMLPQLGCIKPPYYQVYSLADIKKELKDYKEIRYPDLSKYTDDMSLVPHCMIYQEAHNRTVLSGYLLSLDNYASGIEGLFIDHVAIGCDRLLTTHKIDQWLPALKPNATYRTVDVEYSIYIETITSVNKSNYPNHTEGTCIYTAEAAFDMYGYRYSMSIGIDIQPSDHMPEQVKRAEELAREEVYRLIDSIIDYKGENS